MGTTRNWVWTANLSNSIVGVSVLAMPFCIQQCGLILGLLLLLFSATLTKWSCGLLIRAAQISRRSSYEALALSTFGPLGKNIVEVSIIGLQLGTCIAFYVIIGDLAPPTIARMTGISWSPTTLRSIILCASAIVIVLPLAMLRDIANLSSISVASLSFYGCFLLYLLCLALPNAFGGKVWSHLTWWNTNGIFKCMPIFSLAFACHTQLLIIYDQHPDPSLSRMSTITSNAINLTASLYGLVAIGGYFTFCINHVEGDILSNFYPSLISQLIKLCFALSVVVSFPMMIFPCRVSINSLISQIPIAPLETPVRIPQSKFIPITIFITFATLAVAIVLPQIETVLALTGATAGSLISFIYPASIFLSVTRSRDEYRTTAKVVMGIGILILMVSTVSILISNMEDTTTMPKSADYPWPQPKMPDNFPVVKDYKDVLPNGADKEGGAKEKVGGGGGDTHVEQYPDKPIVKTEGSEAKQSSPTSPSVRASDSTEATTANDDHKKLISKLEVLEERVEKLESENQELKKEKESEKFTSQTSDNKQDGEKKISENLVKTETNKDDETVKSHKMVPKSDDSLSQGKDNTPDAAVHKQPADSLQSDVHMKSKTQEHGQQQRLTQDETKEGDTRKLHPDPITRKQLNKENDLVADKNLQDVEHKEQSKHDVPIPDLVVDKNTHDLAPQDDSQKFRLEDHPGKGTEKQHDNKNPEIDLDQKSEHKITNDQGEQPAGHTKRSVDDNLQNFEQNLPKLDTGGDMGILSRDLLHDSKQHDEGDTKLELTTDASQEKVDSTQTTVSAMQDRNATKTEPKNVVKRDILSLKLTSDNETQSLSNG